MRARAGFVAVLAGFALRCSSFEADQPASPTGDAGLPDGAAPIDASDDASRAVDVSNCLFCDDFEASAIRQDRWTLVGDRAPFSLDATMPRGGKQSLRLALPDGDGENLVGHVALDGKGTWTTYLRLSTTKLLTAQPPVGLLSVGYGAQFADTPHGLAELELTADGMKIWVQGDAGSKDAPAQRFTDFDANTWLEVVVAFDFHANRVKVTIDGRSAPGLEQTGFDFKAPTVLAGGIDVRIGRLASGPAVTAWVDDMSVE